MDDGLDLIVNGLDQIDRALSTLNTFGSRGLSINKLEDLYAHPEKYLTHPHLIVRRLAKRLNEDTTTFTGEVI